MLQEPCGVCFNSWAGKEKTGGMLQCKRELLNLFPMTVNASTSWNSANQSTDVLPVLCHRDRDRLETQINCLQEKLIVLFIYIGFFLNGHLKISD